MVGKMNDGGEPQMVKINNPVRKSMSTKPIYSICMVNLDMEKYLEASVLSIYNQLDQNYEIIIVDGGSKDGSVEILKKMERHLDRLKVVYLKRDSNRKLGQDRNISIQEANGEYVLLHLDCDDLYYPHIKDWVNIFHTIESCFNEDQLVAGAQINMGKRDFLLSHGPYKNLHFEDRELWNRLEKSGNLIRLKHHDVRSRMPIPQPDRTIKTLSRTYKRISEDLEQPETKFYDYLLTQIKNFFSKPLKNTLLNISIAWICFFRMLFSGKGKAKVVDLESYSPKPRLTVNEILKHHGKTFPPGTISDSSIKIFDAA